MSGLEDMFGGSARPAEHRYSLGVWPTVPFSTRRRGHLVVVGAFEEGGVIGVHLQRGLTGDIRRTSTPYPSLGVEELARIVRTVA